MQNLIKVPTFLHDIHGKKTTWTDILFVHLVAAATTFCAIILVRDAGWEAWKFILLGLVAYDLGGGAIANFTYSTNSYYAQSQKRRIKFLCLHFLQPAAIAILVPDYLWMVLSFSGYILMASFIVNAITDMHRQAVLGACFSVAGILVLLMLSTLFFHPPTLILLFIVFVLKLPHAFSVRWYGK